VDTQKPEQNTPEVSAGEACSAETLEGQLAAVTAERDRLNGENGELEDRLLRLRAEFENYRRRVERERSEYLQYAPMEPVREILPVLDDF
jgi:molecular chaperone GrpE